MKRQRNLIQDPVCGMMADPGQISVDYLGIHYAFCSLQCRERFTANPRLYVGRPGHKAPGQEGVAIIKRRRLRLASPLAAAQADELVRALEAMMGIRQISAAGDRVEISYDLLQASAEQIEARLAEIGVQLGEGWADRLRRAFVHYEEECEMGNLSAEKTCCRSRSIS